MNLVLDESTVIWKAYRILTCCAQDSLSLAQQVGLTLKQEIETSGFDSYLYMESAANLLAVHLLKCYSTQKFII
ncbi:hypothetical protein [Nostoc sp.]|uniref:hypothetical protein n=1 Tax=Nostoc sp. TaxID=1180 RepID=UPI002FF9B26F